jgi:hypothetical protein
MRGATRAAVASTTTTRLTLALALALALALGACGPSPEAASPVGITGEGTKPPAPTDPSEPEAKAEPRAGKTLFVGPALIDCEGEGPRKCLQVRESPSDAWTLFYDAIEGFEHEEGFSYELRVETASVSSPPADGSSERTRLVEVVTKEKAEPAK